MPGTPSQGKGIRHGKRHLPEQTAHRDGDDREEHLRAGGDAEHERARDRIAEEGLDQEAGQRKRAAEQRREQNARQTDAPDDIEGDLVRPVAAQKHRGDRVRGHVHASYEDADRDRGKKQYKKRQEYRAAAHGIPVVMSIHRIHMRF